LAEKLDTQRKAQYILNRVEMLKTLKSHRKIVEKIAVNGVETDEEHRIAKIACCMIASEYYYDESVMEDKTGGDNFLDELDL
jgi:hypothetical protein